MSTDLRKKRSELIGAAKSIVDTARAESRDLTEAEQAEVEKTMTDVKGIDVQIKGQSLVREFGALGGSEPEPETGETAGAKTLGEHFAKHVGAEGFARLKSQSGYTVAAPEFDGAKAATDPHVVGSGTVFAPQLTQVDTTNWARAYRPGPVVADLLGSGVISGNAVSYFVEGAMEGDFAWTAELGQKPQIHMVNPTQVTDSLRKIAAWWDMSDEMVEDLPFLQSEINNRALYMLGMKEEAALLNGPGTGNTFVGLLNRSGVQTETAAAGGADNADALFRAMTKVQTATGLAADGIIIHPTDYQRLRLAKDANGQYFGGGFFSGQYGAGGILQQPPLWGLRTVVTTAVAAGNAVVGAFGQAATVYRKGGIRVESTNSDAGKFTTNVITTRIEERVALAVRIPSAIVKVTQTAPA